MRKAQLISLVTYGPAALPSVPWLQRLPPGKALAGLLAIHVLRVLALFAIPARRDGFPLSKAALTEIVGGDLIGAALASAGVIVLLSESRWGIWLAWLVVIETVLDLAIAIRRRRREPGCPHNCMGLVAVQHRLPPRLGYASRGSLHQRAESAGAAQIPTRRYFGALRRGMSAASSSGY